MLIGRCKMDSKLLLLINILWNDWVPKIEKKTPENIKQTAEEIKQVCTNYHYSEYINSAYQYIIQSIHKPLTNLLQFA